ncbi:MAG: TlpA family protein disulfide reductase [Deltaproteobacteria bacterium]|nr:MAG: TlpA family protein disulfide reductase [Deltaproteobacteria bacterium]
MRSVCKGSSRIGAIFLLWLGMTVGAGIPAKGFPATSQVYRIDAAGLETLLRFHRRHGRPVLLNFWATWCDPCVQEFPALVAVQRTYPRESLGMILVSLDEPGEVERAVLPFLQRFGIDFPVYLLDPRNAPAAFTIADPKWDGSIPATILYDRGGKRVVRLVGAQKFETLKAHIDLLLNAGGKE